MLENREELREQIVILENTGYTRQQICRKLNISPSSAQTLRHEAGITSRIKWDKDTLEYTINRLFKLEKEREVHALEYYLGVKLPNLEDRLKLALEKGIIATERALEAIRIVKRGRAINTVSRARFR